MSTLNITFLLSAVSAWRIASGQNPRESPIYNTVCDHMPRYYLARVSNTLARLSNVWHIEW